MEQGAAGEDGWSDGWVEVECWQQVVKTMDTQVPHLLHEKSFI